MADLLGLEVVQSRLRRKIRIFSIFSGIDCQKFAWQFLSAACVQLWQFEPAVTFEFSVLRLSHWQKHDSYIFCLKPMLLSFCFVFEHQVEKEKVKQAMLQRWFGHDSSCLFGDITKMCENELRDNVLLDPKKVKWKPTAWCRAHGKECCINLPHNDDTESLGVLGSPCQLFSRPLA